MPRHNTNSSSSHARPPRHASSAKDQHAGTDSADSASQWLKKSVSKAKLNQTGLKRLDGRTLEGGGQLLRVALTLSALLAIPVQVSHIRGNRAGRSGSGGLKESHLAALRFLQGRSRAQVYGGEVGSVEMVFLPGFEGEVGKSKEAGAEEEEEIEIVLKNPGSVWLIFQAIYPYLVFRGTRRGGREDGRGSPPPDEEEDRPLELSLTGGTNVSKSMSAEYVQQVLLPTFRRIGLPRCEVVVEKRGWSHGSRTTIGKVKIKMWPLSDGAVLPAFAMGETKAVDPKKVRASSVTKIVISVLASPAEVRDHLISSARKKVREEFPDAEAVLEVDEDSGDPRRLYMLAVAHLEGGWVLGRDCLWDQKLNKADLLSSGTNAVEKMAERVMDELGEEVGRGVVVDEYMQDQLVVFQALALGRCGMGPGVGEGSLHTQTVRWVVEEVLGTDMASEEQGIDGFGLMAGKGEVRRRVDNKRRIMESEHDRSGPVDALEAREVAVDRS